LPPTSSAPPGLTPEAVAWVPVQSSPLLDVTEAPVAPTTLTYAPVPEEKPEEVPEYVPPVREIKSYRN
jgi:hypothetical protein